jgi:hypothetical protein
MELDGFYDNMSEIVRSLRNLTAADENDLAIKMRQSENDVRTVLNKGRQTVTETMTEAVGYEKHSERTNNPNDLQSHHSVSNPVLSLQSEITGMAQRLSSSFGEPIGLTSALEALDVPNGLAQALSSVATPDESTVGYLSASHTVGKNTGAEKSFDRSNRSDTYTPNSVADNAAHELSESQIQQNNRYDTVHAKTAANGGDIFGEIARLLDSSR